MNRFKPGDIVEITETSKSKYKGATVGEATFCGLRFGEIRWFKFAKAVFLDRLSSKG